jgi:hypothetical protein
LAAFPQVLTSCQTPLLLRDTSVRQYGSLQEGYFVAELTGVNTREGWPEGMRLIVRQVHPTRRPLKKLTAFEKRTGWPARGRPQPPSGRR